jgi:molecular chaperone DnaJ
LVSIFGLDAQENKNPDIKTFFYQSSKFSAKIAVMPNKSDYYEILGVNKNASADEIKQAYKKLAKQHHPDMVSDKDKDAAEKRFKEINEAYQILNDPQKRKMYDQFGHAGVGQGPSGAGAGAGFGQQGQWGPFTYSYSNGNGENSFDFGNGFDPFDVFEEFFGFRGFGRNASPRRGKNLYYEISLDFAEVVRGVEKEIRTEAGKAVIKIPVGVRNGTELRFAGKGMPGPNNIPAGDLFLSIRVKYPKEFMVEGDNIIMVREISFIQAAIGDVIEIPVVDPSNQQALGKAKLTIPAGTQPLTKFLVRGKGMPRLHGSGRGDVLVQVLVTIPKKLTKKQKELLEEFKKQS